MIINKKIILSFLVLFSILVNGQENNKKILEGKVTYFSSFHTYIKFDSTEGIKLGDTLFVKLFNKYQPSFLVEHISSKSCAALSLQKLELKVGNSVFAFINFKNADLAKSTDIDTKVKSEILITDEPKKDTNVKPIKKMNGKLSISSYSDISDNNNYLDKQKWRARFSWHGENLFDSHMDINSYFTFSYRTHEWKFVQQDLFNALRIYNLSAKYNFNNGYKLLFGREINSRISNVGAVDGIQFQKEGKIYNYGFIVGSRPDYKDYTFNPKLLQFGGYIQRVDSINKSIMLNTIAVFEQTFKLKTDRRFLYFQHQNNFVKNLFLFLSSEIDLYKNINDSPSNTFSLTSFYLNANYRVSSKLSFSTSYGARKNVIYYETFRSYADSIYEASTRQGIRFRTNIRPFSKLMLVFNYGYRFLESDLKPTQNYSGLISYSAIPIISSSASVSYSKLTTNYLEGYILGLRISKDYFNSSINLSSEYNYVNYNYIVSDYNFIQHILLLELGTRLFNNIYFSASYEGTFEEQNSFARFYLNLSTRF